MLLYIMKMKKYIYIYIYISEALKAYKDKNSGPATGTRGIAVTASALEKPGTWVRLPASVRFLFVPLRPFFYAALANRWKVQFRQG